LNISLAAIVLVAALLHATWNALLKGGADRAWTMTVMQTATLAVATVSLFFVPLPAPASWPWLAGGALLHAGYRASLVQAFGHGDLGEIYPISRGASPMMVTIAAALVAGDYPRPITLFGIALSSLGIMGLAGSGKRRLPTRAILAALSTAAFTASYTVVDGSGARRAGDPLAFIVWLFVLGGIGTLVWNLSRRPARKVAPTLKQVAIAVCGGLISTSAYGIVIWATTLGSMGAVSALRETSVVFALLMGRLFLNERVGPRRLFCCVAVALGCGCIAL
jgi:drug/metabolite transporter (DMT)-like permease